MDLLQEYADAPESNDVSTGPEVAPTFAPGEARAATHAQAPAPAQRNSAQGHMIHGSGGRDAQRTAAPLGGHPQINGSGDERGVIAPDLRFRHAPGAANLVRPGERRNRGVRERREHAARRREPFASFGPELPLSIVRALEAIQNGEAWVYPLELTSDIEDGEQIGEVDEGANTWAVDDDERWCVE